MNITYYFTFNLYLQIDIADLQIHFVDLYFTRDMALS